LKTATQPFRFLTASYITQIGNQKAANLLELAEGLHHCSDASIFYHTFQSLGRYHFITEGFSNDFAQWVLAGLNRARLAEQLAALDIRDYMALPDLRRDLLRLVEDYCASHPNEATQAAFETFYFCESREISVPLTGETWTLEEFRTRLAGLSHSSLQFHFLVSRLRLHLCTNDFSKWFEDELHLPALANRANRIDIYTNTLEGVQEKLLSLIDRELAG
jgi:hypothetical protein